MPKRTTRAQRSPDEVPAPTKKGAREPSKAASAPQPDGPFEVVQLLVMSVPPGKVTTYGALSRLIGGRLTPAGVGWAIHAAPEGKIPWQRVVNAQGCVSTDNHHPGLQRALLEAEGVQFGQDGRIDLKRFGWDPEAN